MKYRLKNLLIVLISLLAIPLIGLLIAYNIDGKYESDFITAVAESANVTTNEVSDKGITLSAACSENGGEGLGLRKICDYVEDILLLKTASIYSLIGGFILILFVLVSRRIIGLKRKRLAALFSPITLLTMLGLSASIIVQGTILVYGVYISEVVYTEHFHPKLIIILGLGAIIAAYILIKSVFASFKSNPTLVFGEKITGENGNGLIGFVNNIANAVGARAPDNIVLGLEPSFYVTAATVALAGDKGALKGTTMYLSLPFLSIFSKEELVAVIGHELGHFKGEDTLYTMRFYPAYSRLYNALNGLNEQAQKESAANIFGIPAIATLTFVLNEFSITERTIGRGREFEADKVGASVAGGLALITALLKVSVYAELWNELRRFNIQKLAEGVVYNDLANIYCEASENRYGNLNFEETIQNLLVFQMSHLTDTHPTLNERMSALNIENSKLKKELLKPANTDLNEYFSEIEKLTENLSVNEHRLMVAFGYVALPDNQQ
jgi:Zn-dependent protease with chaperone function